MTTILRSLHRGFHFSSSKLSKASNLAEKVIVILNWLILFIEKVNRSLQKVPFGLQLFWPNDRCIYLKWNVYLDIVVKTSSFHSERFWQIELVSSKETLKWQKQDNNWYTFATMGVENRSEEELKTKFTISFQEMIKMRPDLYVS